MLRYHDTLALIAVAVIVVALYTTAPSTSIQQAQSLLHTKCATLYFLNAIDIYNSTVNDTLILETPGNITLDEGFQQTVEALLAYNVVFNDSSKQFTFNTSIGRGFFGFFTSRITVCYPDGSSLLEYYKLAFRNPMYSPSLNASMPSDLVEKYVRQPYSKIAEVVVPAFEKWFNETHGIPVSSASSLGLAVNAAYFVYREYFTYNGSSIPRSIDEVISTGQGDCDDLSRVLVELLNYYHIPALIAYGYVYIPDINESGVFTTSIENVTYVFLYNGPHAFTVAYIPSLGWLSLDFLAGSLLEYPFVFEGYTRETLVNETSVEELVNLHKEIDGVQVLAVLNESEYLSLVARSESAVSSIQGYVEELARRYKGLVETSTQTLQTQTTESTPISSTTFTPPPTSTFESPSSPSMGEWSSRGTGTQYKIVVLAALLVAVALILTILLVLPRLVEATSPFSFYSSLSQLQPQML
ncbi:MAG: transglutaminase-like domain-containing protein [Desulfurococcus sp.]|nr:transglutaminase-like domain-containing protein [Desulfurococcus sp.]